MSLSGHFNAFKFKNDLWSQFSHACKHLADDTQGETCREQLMRTAESSFADIERIERYWAFPGKHALENMKEALSQYNYHKVCEQIAAIKATHYATHPKRSLFDKSSTQTLHFTLLFVIDENQSSLQRLIDQIKALHDEDEKFKFDVLVLHSIEEAVIATTLNYDIQACVIYFDIPQKDTCLTCKLPELSHMLDAIHANFDTNITDYSKMGLECGRLLHAVRPNLDLYLINDIDKDSMYKEKHAQFRHEFYTNGSIYDIYSNIIDNIKERYRAPFFDSLVHYSKKPKGSFHALPIARAASLTKSEWIFDMLEFYGPKIFMAETSATSGGLDSLIVPKGSIKDAQASAAKTFGAERTFFVTSGTSTSNKIVLEALVQPGDVVLADRNCHISHHYSFVLTGANVVYLDAYMVNDYLIYGTVSIDEIKKNLLRLKKEGLLNKAKALLLTNCTFDGIIYNVEKLMREVLAIKPDMVFLWDEAWFAYARFVPLHRTRTAMHVAEKLKEELHSEQYAKNYKAAKNKAGMPDPSKVKIRVYATQSTHKSLSSFRQGSMIHVHDEEFDKHVSCPFHESYLMHTTTSPNYQIVGSLDLARRQVDFEGYRITSEAIEMAMTIRGLLREDALLSKYFKVLGPSELIPEKFRRSHIKTGYNPEKDWEAVTQAWQQDEFVLCPTRISIGIANTGIEGAVFKNEYLMEKHDIQVNKNSRNTILIITNIGTDRSAVSHIIHALTEIAKEIDTRVASSHNANKQVHALQVKSLTHHGLKLPNFTHLHPSFCVTKKSIAGELRTPYYKGYNEEDCDYILLESKKLKSYLTKKTVLVSAVLITPCPPGFPVLVPGQVINKEITDFLATINPAHIIGYDPDLGIKIFKPGLLK